jgi:hypothetical protein
MTKDRSMNDYEEREVMGGVYITDFRTGRSTQSRQDDSLLRKLAPHEIAERQNQVFHLERSNRELRDADPDALDEGLQQAIHENDQIIIKYKLEIQKALQDQQENTEHYQ